MCPVARTFACLLLAAALCGPAASQETARAPLHRELEFALKLQQMGYGHLAADQLIRTRERDFLPAEVRLEATRLLAGVYQQLGERAAASRDFEQKHAFLRKAIEEYGRFLQEAKDTISAEQRCEVLFKRGSLCAELGRDALASMEGTADEQERKDYKAQAVELMDKAVADLEESGRFFANLRDTLYKSARTRQEKIRLWQAREKAGEVLMEWGKALYESSRAYQDEKEAALRDKKLTAAIQIFQGIAEHYSIFDLRYKAFRYIGLCYRGMGQYAKAVEFLRKATQMQRIPDTVWTIRLARYNLAQTYNDWGQYEKADVAAEALISDVYPEMVARQGEDPDLVDAYFAAWLEKGRALVGHAKELMAKAQEAEKKNQGVLAEERRRQARRDYLLAVQKAREISAHPTSRWARNAKMLLDKWIEESEVVYGEGHRIPLAPDINTHMSEGWRLFKEGKYLECIAAFQRAAMMGDPAVYGRTLIPEAWYQMGLAYYNLSMPEHTGGTYNYYHEAALCFGHVAERYPKAAFAADAAYYAQQLRGALFEQTRQIVKQGGLPRSALVYDGRRYYRALQRFSLAFPRDPRSRGTLFQSAELARTLEQYEEASDIYARIKQEHPRYYEAKYRAGLCLYLAALKLYDESPEPPLKRIGTLLDGAARRYQEYVDWFANNRDRLGGEQLQQANRWVLQSKIAYGKLLVHEAWGKTHDAAEGARRALQVLAAVEQEHLGQGVGAELKERYLPEAFFVIIQAYRRLGQLEQAERFVNGLVERFGEHALSSRAARLLGYAYLQRRKELQEQNAPAGDVELAARKAGRYLQKALELDPEQSLAVYNDTAGELYRMQEYRQAERILSAGLQRFPLREGEAPTRPQLVALTALEDCYVALEDWQNVELYASRLLRIEREQNAERRRKGEPEARNVDVRRDYALALEKQGKLQEAIRYWREVKVLAERMEGEEGKQIKFTATLHLAASYARNGQVEHGYKVMAWYLISTADWLRKAERAQSVEKLYDEFFQRRYPQLGETVMQLISADVTLLRDPHSRETIVGLFDRHWPQRRAALEEMIRKAQVPLRTGQ